MTPAEIRKEHEAYYQRQRERERKHFPEPSEKDFELLYELQEQQERRWQQFCAAGVRAGKAAQAEERERQKEAALVTARFAETQRRQPRPSWRLHRPKIAAEEG